MSTGAGRVQRWLVGYVERWEDDEDGFVSKSYLRAGWHLHELASTDSDEHPVPGLTYTATDAFDDRVMPHRKQRSHSESSRRALARLCQDKVFDESPDKLSVRLPVAEQANDDLTRRLTTERDYLKSHGHAASDELLVAVAGNIVVIELERQLNLKERMSFNTRCIERGDSPTARLERLVDYVATKSGVSRDHALGAAVNQARFTIVSWREEDL